MLIPLNLNAAGKDNETSDLDKPLAHYKNGIQFYIVNGVSIAYKKIFSKKSALRFHLDLSGAFLDENSNRDYIHETENDTMSYVEDGYYKSNKKNISFNMELLSTILNKKYISLYYGGGPYIGYSISKYRNEGDYDDEYMCTYSDNQTVNYMLGVIGIVGLESKVAKNIALFAEYHLLFSHSWRDYEYNYKTYYEDGDYSITHSNESTKSWKFEFNNVTIGVSVYF